MQIAAVKTLKLLSLYLLLHLLAAPQQLYAQVYNVTIPSEYYAALDSADIGKCTEINVYAKAWQLSKPLTNPTIDARNKLRRLNIYGHGCFIEVMDTMEAVFNRGLPLSEADARDNYQSQGFTIDGFFIDCKGLARYGILQRATYHDYIHHVTVVGATQGGIVERFGMNAIIEQCEVRACLGYGIALMNGDWNGAGKNRSGSNMASIRNCRVFPKQDQDACFAAICSGNTAMYDNIVDYAQRETFPGSKVYVDEIPKRGVLIDNSGSTTCKLNLICGLWAESQTSIAMIEWISSGGICISERCYPQKTGVMIKVSGTNYGQMLVNNWGYISGKFQAATNNSIVWRFNNNASSLDLASTVNWVDSRLPVNFFIEGFAVDQSWQWKTPSNRRLKHNGKNIVTEP